MYLQTIQKSMQHKWVTKFWGFDYEILYTLRRSNVMADALSRIQEPTVSVFMILTISQPLILTQLVFLLQIL